MPKLVSKGGKHTVYFNGSSHEFTSIKSAWLYIFTLKPIIHVASTNIRVSRRIEYEGI